MNNNNLKPLENYLNDIKSRNIKFGEMIPELSKTVENISNYDDLYKKLIEESYYICNELLKNREFQDKESFDCKNIERALKFSSNDKDNNKIFNSTNKKLILDSAFYYNQGNQELNKNNQIISYENTFRKDDNREVFENNIDEIKKSLPNTENLKFLTENENKIKTSKNMSLFSTEKHNNRNNKPVKFKDILSPIYMQQEQNNEKDTKNLISDELLLLVNSSKNIEHMLSTDNPLSKIDIFESEITNELNKLSDIEFNQNSLIESKKGLEIKMNDLNDLFYNFQEHFLKFENLTNNYQMTTTATASNRNFCENCYNNNVANNNSGLGFQKIRDTKNSILKDDELLFNNYNSLSHSVNKQNDSFSNPHIMNHQYYNTVDNNSFPNYNINKESIERNLNQSNKSISEQKPKEENSIKEKNGNHKNFYMISDQINNLFVKNKFNEAVNLWKKYNYEVLENCSIERTNEMHILALKLRDKELEKVPNILKLNESLSKEMTKKNFEMFELFGELELLKDKIRNYEFQLSNLQNIENKVQTIISENSILYRENIKIKTLLEQEQLLNKYKNK